MHRSASLSRLIFAASALASSASIGHAQRPLGNSNETTRQAAERALAAHARYVPSAGEIAPTTRATNSSRHSPAGAEHYVSYGFLPGERVADTRYTDLDGKPGVLNSAGANLKGSIIIFRDAECPVSQRYSPRVAELEKRYAAKGWQFIHVDITPHSKAEALADVAKYGLKGRVVLDTAKHIVGSLRASSSAEAFVIDARGTLRYRGSIDDQYGIGFHKDAAKDLWLINAIERVSAGRDVAVPFTDASGCMFDVDLDTTGAPRPVTNHNRVSRIVQQK